MDGHFVPEITFGSGLVKCLRANLNKKSAQANGAFFDMHMMVENPEKVSYVNKLNLVDYFSFSMTWPDSSLSSVTIPNFK